MRVQLASEPGSADWPNEDFAAVTPGAAVLLDGATIRPGLESGCAHGVAWYARTLGTTLLAAMTADPRGPLPAALGQAIAQVRVQHEHTCDLTNPASPAATVTAVRQSRDGFDYLALSDSTIVADWNDGREPLIITDRRPLVQGYVASTDPAVSGQALTGSLPATGLRGVALLSDGASRLADRFHLRTWPGVLRLIRDGGPAALIRQVRTAEVSDPDCTRWPRGKARDDATVLYWDLPG